MLQVEKELVIRDGNFWLHAIECKLEHSIIHDRWINFYTKALIYCSKRNELREEKERLTLNRNECILEILAELLKKRLNHGA